MNKNSEHIDEKLLLRFLLGETSKEETLQVKEWLHLSEKNQKLLDNYEAIWAEAGRLTPNPVPVDTPSAWDKMSQRIDQFEEKSTIKTIPLKSKLIWISSGIAATIIIVFGIFQLLKQPEISQNNIKLSSAQEFIRYALPDGSQVALNSNSEITYPNQFTNNERRIKLEGEAFFNVKSRAGQPFIIETKNAFVQVLGTSFNVKAYADSDLEVIVTEGIVKLYIINSKSLDTSAIILEAGQKGRIPLEERKPVYVAEQIPDELYWLDYTLIFNDTDLKKVFELLENYHNVEIQVNDTSIYYCRLSTIFTNNSIDEILEVIAATFEFEYTKDNNIITIKGNGCSGKNI